jgi:thiol-disulfide isomerase/thioredoxin
MAKRKRRNKAQNQRRESKNQKYMPFVLGGAAILLILVVGFAVVLAVNSSGSGSNFDFEVYQGSDILGGENLSLDDVLALNKPLVLNFWAGDCPPCRAEMPAFQRIYEDVKDEVVFLGLDVGVFTGLGTKASALRLLDDLRITYPIGAPPNRSAVVSYAVRSMPTTVFFDATGKIVDRVDGAISEFRMATIVDEIREPS